MNKDVRLVGLLPPAYLHTRVPAFVHDPPPRRRAPAGRGGRGGGAPRRRRAARRRPRAPPTEHIYTEQFWASQVPQPSAAATNSLRLSMRLYAIDLPADSSLC